MNFNLSFAHQKKPEQKCACRYSESKLLCPRAPLAGFNATCLWSMEKPAKIIGNCLLKMAVAVELRACV